MDKPNPAPRTLVLNEKDNVAIALSVVEEGAVTPQGVTARARVPKGHKIAIRAIASGAPVLKFGQIIGFATKDIAPGDLVHVDNVGMGALSLDYAFAVDARDDDVLPLAKPGRPSKGSAAPTARSARAIISAS